MASSFIKLYWSFAFNKQRPSIIPNYVIPNEHEVLHQLSRNSGLCVTANTTVDSFVQSGLLQSTNIANIQWVNLFFISNKKTYNKGLSQYILETVRKET